MIKKLAIIIILMISLSSVLTAQELEKTLLQSLLIKPELKKNANAVIRFEEVNIEIEGVDAITIKTKQVITILNKYGNRYVTAQEWYDPTTKIKKQKAIFYDLVGNEIKKYKKSDFEDRSAVDNVSLITDNRIKYINYTPISYPYTMVYESEVTSRSTAFIPFWNPIMGYRLSVENATYKIYNPQKVEIRKKEQLLNEFDVKYSKNDTEDTFSYSISNIAALAPEYMSPSYRDITPKVTIALKDFTLVDVEGSAEDWKSFGKWQYDHLVVNRNQLPEETVQEVSELIKTARSNKEKAKIIYDYVQKKTRYISVQLGIGGWLPMEASEVDKLGYGDCKALTNYTKALLDSQKIPAYYTVVFGDRTKRNIDKNFASMQGNHVILNVPNGEEDLWLECTSQTTPFGYIGNFTDDRDVLVIQPEGGVIKRTKKYLPEESTLITKAMISIAEDRSMNAELTLESKGIQYDHRYDLESESRKDQDDYYKEYWDYINGIKINTIEFSNDKENVVFVEKLKVSAKDYVKKIGERLIFIPNAFNREQVSLPSYKERKQNVIISRGYKDIDEYVFTIPEGYKLGGKADDKVLVTDFGTYSYSIKELDNNKILFKREVLLKDGSYGKEKYKEYKEFKSTIKKTDKSKILLIKK